MYRLQKEFRFESAHFLPNHDGKCKRLHGHSFKGYLCLENYEIITTGPKAGMLMDFGDISKVLVPLIDELDHRCLNDIKGLDNPTSELIAKWVYDRLFPLIPTLMGVRIEETCTCAAEYWGE